MKAKTSIAPHFGAANFKLRCHFPLFVPDEAFLRVAADPRPWQEGKMIVFDDTYEHEAANLSEKEDRVILLIDIWHPDLHV
jgi:aspartyl/asparaginyl beta-hydroxylase (cupin superfamily)